MKPPKPKPVKPQARWAIADADGVVQWVARPDQNTRSRARDLAWLYFDGIGYRITRVLITEAPHGRR